MHGVLKTAVFDADGTEVAGAIARMADTPFGERPFHVLQIAVLPGVSTMTKSGNPDSDSA
jgi:hypothetical protein